MVLNSLFISGRCKYIKLFPRINKKGKISLAPPELSIKTNGYYTATEFIVIMTEGTAGLVGEVLMPIA